MFPKKSRWLKRPIGWELTAIEQFLNFTPRWLEVMEKYKELYLSQGHCNMCGISPEFIQQLLEEVRELKEKNNKQ